MGVSKNKGTPQCMVATMHGLYWKKIINMDGLGFSNPHQPSTKNSPAFLPIISYGRPILMMVRRSRRKRGGFIRQRDFWDPVGLGGQFYLYFFRKICVIFSLFKETCVGFSLDTRVIGSNSELSPGFELHPSG